MRQLRITQKFTNRDSVALEKYFKEVQREASISADEEVLLAKRIRMGDMEALDKLVKANLRFVISVAKQYEGYGMSLEDLISEGNIGLIKAARRFDDSRGYKFISYAVFWIRQCILKALNENARIIRLPSNQVAQLQKIQAEFSRLEQEYGFEPSAEAIGEALNLQPKDVIAALKHSQKPVSLDAPMGDDEDNSMLNMISDDASQSPDHAVMQQSLIDELSRALDKLNIREAEVIRMNFGLEGRTPMMLDDIAGNLGLGRERVRQLKVQALRKMQRMTLSRKLRAYL